MDERNLVASYILPKILPAYYTARGVDGIASASANPLRAAQDAVRVNDLNDLPTYRFVVTKPSTNPTVPHVRAPGATVPRPQLQHITPASWRVGSRHVGNTARILGQPPRHSWPTGKVRCLHAAWSGHTGGACATSAYEQLTDTYPFRFNSFLAAYLRTQPTTQAVNTSGTDLVPT